MTRDEALARCESLNREQTDERRWFAKQNAVGEWEIVSLSGTGFGAPGPLRESSEARPRPSEPPDPRPTIFRNIPPYGAG